MTKPVCPKNFGLDDLACGCIVVDETRCILSANRYIADEFGWDVEQVAGKRIEGLMSRASHLFCESYIYPMLIKDGKCNDVQLTFVSPDGTRTPVIANLKGLEDAVVWGIFSAENRDKLYQELVEARSQLEDQARQLKLLSTTDELTGLMNRRALTEHVEKMFDGASRTGEAITVLLLDVDDFKKINDTYGHNFGDDVLRKIGASLAATCRASELVARYGGEEFVFVLKSEAIHGAMAFANRVHGAVKAALKDTIPITVSIGIAARMGRFGPPFVELLGKADKALFKAKATGKNKTVVGGTVRLSYQANVA
ncbi:diguanylate cyclase [Tateyamaria sp. SN3-11]|uniref:sensor domain-containing diguanylate cyclase n=1 Tax=Tateyamaria sp. SN3-11 TaxID=3092147 RepID=UPI0039ED7365